jgi:hypothetical protein
MQIFNVRCNAALAIIFGFMFSFQSYAWAKGLMPRPGEQVDSTNFDDNAFSSAINKFAGTSRGNYFGDTDSDQLVYQMLSGIGIPDEPFFRVESGFGVVSGCVYKDCPNKEIVVFNKERILEVGLINYHCGKRKVGRKTYETVCDNDPTLSIFKKKNFNNPVVDAIIKKWGDANDRPKIEEISLP